MLKRIIKAGILVVGFDRCLLMMTEAMCINLKKDELINE